jgi:N-acetylmuramoyl-L-alanine amidase
MDESGLMTRRTMLGGMAAAGAASLVCPPVAGALAQSRSVSSRWIGSLSGTSAPVPAPRRFVLAGVQWADPPHARVELRARPPDGRWSPWVVASVVGHDPDGSEAAGRARSVFGEPVWTGASDSVQLRSDRPIHGLRVHFVSLAAPRASAAAAALPLAQPRLDAGPGQPAIIAREAWAQGQAPPRHAAEYGTIKLAFVHHTVNPNGYSAGEVPSMLLAIYDYHVQARGFWDIAYNFIIDLYGRIWEGRAGGIDMAVIGAQAGGYNAESTGVAVLGDFMDVVPSGAAVEALKQVLAWKLALHGIPSEGRVTVVVNPAEYYYTPFGPGAHVSLPRVAGHRDGDSTDCPGDAFYAQLPSIRPGITALAGMPARITINTPPSVVTAGVSLMVSGSLRTLGGAPLRAAPIELQQRSPAGESTVARLVTGPDGSWRASVSLRHNTTVRALHRPHPATVADWVELGVAPAITLSLVSTAPLQVSGTVFPPTPSVTIDAYSGARRLGKPVSSKRLAAKTGHFHGKIEIARRGHYVLVARSHADSSNVAGASPALTVSI